MKRAILFIGYDFPLHDELREFVAGVHGEAFFAEGTEQAIRVLDRHDVEKVVLNLRSLQDAAILRYLQLHYERNVQVIVSASAEYDQLIAALRQGDYSRLPQPLRLEELKSMI